MAWVKLDDRSWCHPKLVSAGLAARGLDVAGMCWSSLMQTDGFVRADIISQVSGHAKNARELADILVRVGRWEVDPRGGWLIHDFLKYNPSAADQEAKRQDQADQKARWRAEKAAKAAKASAKRPARTIGVRNVRTLSGADKNDVRDLSALPDPAPNTSKDVLSETRSRSLREENSDALRLCEVLAADIGNHRAGPPPAVTQRWRTDMRLLLERGPTDQDKPEVIAPERVERAMSVLFTQLAIRDNGFCWADQIRSPGALREHWHQIRVAAMAATNGTAGHGRRSTIEDEFGNPIWADS